MRPKRNGGRRQDGQSCRRRRAINTRTHTPSLTPGREYLTTAGPVTNHSSFPHTRPGTHLMAECLSPYLGQLCLPSIVRNLPVFSVCSGSLGSGSRRGRGMLAAVYYRRAFNISKQSPPISRWEKDAPSLPLQFTPTSTLRLHRNEKPRQWKKTPTHSTPLCEVTPIATGHYATRPLQSASGNPNSEAAMRKRL
ncbi:hypothetical protein BU24DRAFT_205554 [Aaosphaeria arxii CBS 175.79]|uniref:Uncharacterized protein n=1 Tax=Aaosphaeria arxii CBS 175.79 TaxID=1450172 RepID=A0A6A5XUH3_9PLEO|nr:uncharacterized protein BU24DRAFT_205554 [Aaosphaeria arxii CBS 175.79]KAF2016576.1 hypothetical protein BU24DRAFT_205554 [Aaosphaeria arxii CBS 175.79]